MSNFGDDPYAHDAAYEGGNFFEVSDRKGMVKSHIKHAFIGNRSTHGFHDSMILWFIS